MTTMTRYTWDEIAGTINGWSDVPEGQPLTAISDDWQQIDITRGVTMFRDSRGHVALECEATDPLDALSRFLKWSRVAGSPAIRSMLEAL